MSQPAFVLLTLSVCAIKAAQAPAKADFGRRIKPLLEEHCVECHGPTQQMRGLRLEWRRDALPNRVGANGARIVPGNSARSVLFRRMAGAESGPRMPPPGPLPEPEIKLIQAWIDQGGGFPDELSGHRNPAPADKIVQRMRAALRESKPAEFQRLAKANPQSVNAKGEGGWTLLMHAALGSLLDCAPKSQRAEYRKAVDRAVGWLESAEPAGTEDRAFPILGWIWGAGSRERIRETASRLLAMPRADGGWGQTPALASDAYATGQALVALRESGVLAAGSPARPPGAIHLVQSQLEDGSWLVRSRAPSFQPYFDSGFPHGFDQFVPAAANNWAVMALMPAAR